MITADEARILASIPLYERQIKAAAEKGEFSSSASFMDRTSAIIIRETLISRGFVCSKIIDRDGRDGTNFDFRIKWE